RGVDPVEAGVERGADGGDRGIVVLGPPGELPTATANGPGADADGRDHEIAVAELSLFHLLRCSMGGIGRSPPHERGRLKMCLTSWLRRWSCPASMRNSGLPYAPDRVRLS